MKWQLETEHAAWDPRDSMGTAVFNNKMWVVGGWRPCGRPRINDVWCSEDGCQWERICGQAPWEGRNSPNTLVHDGRLWLFGGGGVNRFFYSDVWCTDDGAHWSCVCNAAPWGPRTAASAVVFDGALWLMAGMRQHNNHYCDVWRSTDGARWEKVLDGAPWGRRSMHTSVVFQDKIWLMAGGLFHNQIQAYNDVWCSKDGVHWEAKVYTAPWSPRVFCVSAVCADRLWLASGNTCWGTGPDKVSDLNDLWSSTDGADWQIVTPASEYKTGKAGNVWMHYGGHWQPRHAPGFLAFRGKLWILGGGQREWNDVWSLDVAQWSEEK